MSGIAGARVFLGAFTSVDIMLGAAGTRWGTGAFTSVDIMLGAAWAFTSVRVTLDVFGSLGGTGALSSVWVALDGSDSIGTSGTGWGTGALTSVDIMLRAAWAFASERVTLDVFGSLRGTGAFTSVWVALDGSDSIGTSWARWGTGAFTSVDIMLGAAGTRWGTGAFTSVDIMLRAAWAFTSVRVTLNGSDSFWASRAVRVLWAMSSVGILFGALGCIDIVLRCSNSLGAVGSVRAIMVFTVTGIRAVVSHTLVLKLGSIGFTVTSLRASWTLVVALRLLDGFLEFLDSFSEDVIELGVFLNSLDVFAFVLNSNISKLFNLISNFLNGNNSLGVNFEGKLSVLNDFAHSFGFLFSLVDFINNLFSCGLVSDGSGSVGLSDSGDLFVVQLVSIDNILNS